MSPANRPARPRAAKAPAAPRPWQRAEAGRYRSADARFTLESGGGGRWFVTDAASPDELGLPRTSGPFATLDAAKAAAERARSLPAEPSPLADRMAAARTRSRDAAAPGEPETGTSRSPGSTDARRTRRPAPPPRTWLDDLADRDPDAARAARRLIAVLEQGGATDADTIVRRDVLGDRPAVAIRLAARAVLDAIAALPEPTAIDVAVAVAGALASGPARDGLPGWELRERDGAGGRARLIRITPDELLAAAGEPPDPRTPSSTPAAPERELG